MSSDATIRPTGCVRVDVSFDIDAPLATVWKCFLNDIAKWWSLANFAATGGTMHLEPRAGGRLYEVATGGHELLWAHVIEILPGQRIFFHGAMGAPYASACVTLYQFNFESISTGTRLSIRDEIIGNVDEKTHQSVTEGWTMLIEQGLKKFVESRA